MIKEFVLGLLNKYTKFQATEAHYNTGVGVVATAFISYLVFGNVVELETVISMSTGIIYNVAFLLIVAFGLQKFQMGTNRDVQKEIFDESNVAAAIYQAGIWIALAIVIAKGLM